MRKFQFWKNSVVSKTSKSKQLKIAIIPARGGSKSIPRKNLQNLVEEKREGQLSTQLNYTKNGFRS